MALDRLTKIDGGGISTTSDYRVGVITATKFVGPIEGSITATDATFSGNVSIAGTLTYEDVINVDSVGIGTFREGIFLPDNKKLQFGNAAGSADLEIFHSSSENKTIIDNNTNDLDIASDVIRLKNSARSETLATFIGNGGVSLYYDNSIKLSTAGWGIQATGILKIADATNSSGATNHLALGASNDLKLFHDGSHNRIHGSTGFLDINNSADLISITASNRIDISDDFIRLRSRDGSDVYMTGTVNSSVDLYFNGSKKFETTSAGAKIDSGQLHIISSSATTSDLDMLIVDGGSTGFNQGNDANTEYGIQFKGCSYSTGTGIQQRVGAQILMRKEGTWNGHNGGGNRCDTTIAFTNSTGLFTNGTLAQVDRLLINSDGNVQIPNDTGKLQLGASQDLQIYHDGSNSIIRDNGTGSLSLQSNGTEIALYNHFNSEYMGRFINNGAVELYHDGAKKLETTNSGITVTGGVTASGFTLGDNQNIQFGASNDLKIFHNGSHSYIADVGTGDLRITGSAVHIQNAVQSENMIRCFENAQVELYYDNSKKFQTTSSGATLTGQLLATSGFKVNDGVHITLGTDNDFKFYHDGTNAAWLNTSGNNYLYGSGGNFFIRPVNGESSIDAIANGAVKLYHDGTKRIETTSSGASVTGNLDIREAHNTAYSATASPNAFTVGNINSSANTNFTGIHLFTDGNGRGVVNLNALNNSASASADFTIQTRHAGTLGERFRITSDGKVGVGNFTSGTAVSQALHVKGSQPEIYLEHTGGYDMTLTTNDGAGNNGITVNGGALSLAYNNKNIWMCRTGGYVSIGHMSPSTRLDVKQNNGVAYNNRVQSVAYGAARFFNESGHQSGGTYTGFQFNLTGDSQNRICSIGMISEASNTRNSSLVFATDDNGNRTEKLRIKSDGNVTISTTATSPTGDFRMLTMIARSDKQASIGFAQASGVYSGATATGGYTVRLATDAALELATHNSNIIALKATQTGNVEMVGDLSTNNLSGRNIVINGDMRVAQRATSASMSNHGNAIPVCDRWNYNRNGVTATIAQVADAPAGYGFKYSLKWTSTSAVGSIHPGNALFFTYNIEGQDIRRLGYGSSGAKKATLSFWAKGSLAGKIGMSCTRDGRIFSANVDMTANTWQHHTITIPTDTSTGFSGNDNASGFLFRFCWGAGSNSTSGTTGGNWINFHNAYTGGFTAGQQGAYLQTNGSTFQITGVQLEIGSQATPFEHRPISEELARCQRYFAIFPGRSGGIPFWQCYMGSSSGYCSIPVPNFNFRVVPTPTDATTGTSSSTGNIYNATGSNINSRFAGNGTVTLSCGGYAPSGVGLIMNFGTHQSGAKEGVVASWNGASPGIFLDAEL